MRQEVLRACKGWWVTATATDAAPRVEPACLTNLALVWRMRLVRLGCRPCAIRLSVCVSLASSRRASCLHGCHVGCWQRAVCSSLPWSQPNTTPSSQVVLDSSYSLSVLKGWRPFPPCCHWTPQRCLWKQSSSKAYATSSVFLRRTRSR